MSESSGSLSPPNRKLTSPERLQDWEGRLSASEGWRGTDARTDFFGGWPLEGRAYGEARVFLVARRSLRLTALIVDGKEEQDTTCAITTGNSGFRAGRAGTRSILNVVLKHHTRHARQGREDALPAHRRRPAFLACRPLFPSGRLCNLDCSNSRVSGSLVLVE